MTWIKVDESPLTRPHRTLLKQYTDRRGLSIAGIVWQSRGCPKSAFDYGNIFNLGAWNLEASATEHVKIK